MTLCRRQSSIATIILLLAFSKIMHICFESGKVCLKSSSRAVLPLYPFLLPTGVVTITLFRFWCVRLLVKLQKHSTCTLYVLGCRVQWDFPSNHYDLKHWVALQYIVGRSVACHRHTILSKMFITIIMWSSGREYRISPINSITRKTTLKSSITEQRIDWETP